MHTVSQRAWGLRLRGISARTRDSALAGVAFPLHPQGRHPSFHFSKLNTQPADASCLRFDDGLTTATARLEVRWFATPFLQDSFIPYCMPVYPGARMRVDGPQFRRPPIPAWPPIPAGPQFPKFCRSRRQPKRSGKFDTKQCNIQASGEFKWFLSLELQVR